MKTDIYTSWENHMISGCALNHSLEKVRAQKCGTSVCSGCAWFVTGTSVTKCRGVGKLLGNLLSSVRLTGCPKKNGSIAPSLRLNSSSQSWDSFLLSLTSAAVAKHAWPFVALLDSGSSHCFVDKLFAMRNKLSLTNLPNLILLRLLMGLPMLSK